MEAPDDARAAGAAERTAGGWPPWWVLPLIAAVQIIGTFGASRGQEFARDVDALTIALLLGGPLAIWLTRRHVVLGAAVVQAITFVYIARGYVMGPVVISPVVALIRVVLAGHRRAAWVLAALGVTATVLGHRVAGEHSDAGWVAVLIVVTWVVVVLVVADIARSRLARREASRRAAAEQQRRQASEERLRIAQELHDVLAHNISMINVQAGVGLHLMDSRPEQAREALSAIKQASKDTLGELRAVLDLLRGTGDAPRMPTGGLADLDALVARVRTADLDVTVRRTGAVREVPPEVDLAAFRIVQEALTNVVRHAPTATAAVVWLDFRDHSLAVHIDDDGRTPAPTPPDHGGNGLAGMRERATALGGSFQAGPRADGGFAVHAVLPTGRALAADGVPAGRTEARP